MFSKKFYFSFLLIGAFFLVGCGSNDSKENKLQDNLSEKTKESTSENLSERIMSVKNGTLNISNALTVGQALDGWKECANPRWLEKDGERGEKMVSFKCDQKNLLDYKKYTEPPFGISPEISRNIKSVQIGIIFTLSTDMSQFSTTSGAYIFNFNDGKQFTKELYDVGNLLTSIYQNKKLEIYTIDESEYNSRQ